MQKILIIISLICFIPTSVFVFAPKDVYFSRQWLNVSSRAYEQIFLPFIVTKSNMNCTFRQAINTNNICFERALNLDFNIFKIGTNGSCIGTFYQTNGLQICSGSATSIIYNNFTKSTNGQLIQTHSPNLLPVFKFGVLDMYYHYIPRTDINCIKIAQSLTSDLSKKYTQTLYKPYISAQKLLWYELLPILCVVLVMLILNQFSTKFNLRKYILMGCFCINIGVITLIVNGAIFCSNVQNFRIEISNFSTCFISEQNQILLQMAKFDYGVSFAFLFFIGLIALLVFLSMVGQIVAKLLEIKYYSSRDRPLQAGIEMSSLKTSLISRRLHNTESSNTRQMIFI